MGLSFDFPDDRADGFLKDGGLRCIVRMAKSSDGAVKKHVGLALYSLAQKGEESLLTTMSSMQVSKLRG